MAAVLTHVLVGVAVGLAADVDARLLPAVAVLAEAIDVDHVFWVLDLAQPVWLTSRGTFHNLFVASVIPALAGALALAHPTLRERIAAPLRRFVAAAPAVLVSHLAFDMVHVHTGEATGGVAAFYPFTMDRFTFPLGPLLRDPSIVDALGLALLAALGFGFVVRWLAGEAERFERPRTRTAFAVVYALVFVVLVPLVVYGAAQRVPA